MRRLLLPGISVAQRWAVGTEFAGLQQADPQMAVFLFIGCFDLVCPC